MTVDLAADRTDIVKVGDTVEIELADGTTTPGTITEIGTVAESGTDAFGNPISPSVTVTIGLDDPAASAEYTNSPVTVRIVRDSRTDVMAVPVSALLAVLEGGYAVEVVDASGPTHLVAVEPGLFQDGWVGGHRPERRPDGRCRDRGAVVTAVAELHGVAKRYPGDPPVEALRGRRPAHRGRGADRRSSGRPDRASRRCCICWARSIVRPKDRSGSPVTTSRRCPIATCPRCGRGGSGSCSSRSSCWAGRAPSTTSPTACCTAASGRRIGVGRRRVRSSGSAWAIG